MIQIDIEMPKDCEECPLCHRAFDGNETRLSCYGLGTWCLGDEGRLDNCPLYEVTDTDTISRQQAIEVAMQYCPDDDGSCSKADRDIRELLDDLENLPPSPTVTADTDTISRQKVISAINSLRQKCDTDDIDDYHDLLVEAIEVFPPSPSRPQWIPCSERLPEKSGQYYVSGGDKVWICEFLIIPNFTSGPNFIGRWCNDVAHPVVQAWMPLPEPYHND